MRADGRPIAGRDYHRTWQELGARLRAAVACTHYLQRLPCPDGFICPRCASRQGWRSKRGLWVCGGCQRQTSVTAGTVFADTHSLLRTWFATAWYVTGQKQGVSALGLQAVLGLGSYETAWSWLHKLRRAMGPTWQGSVVRRCRDGRDIRGRPRAMGLRPPHHLEVDRGNRCRTAGTREARSGTDGPGPQSLHPDDDRLRHHRA